MSINTTKALEDLKAWAAKNPQLAERFSEFHMDNPDVLRRLIELARDFRRRGWDSGSITLLFEHVRREPNRIRTKTGDDYALSNSYKTPYSRVLLIEAPSFSDWLDTRTL